MEGVERHGIPREVVKKMLKDAGFVDVRVETAFEMEKGCVLRLFYPSQNVIELLNLAGS
jgi:hypothetical protein